MKSLIFTLPEALALLGVAQCVYIVAYMGLRAGRLSRAGLPMAYFAVLALAFALDFGQQHLQDMWPYYTDLQWLAWFAGPPLSVLLIVQIARIHEVPHWSCYWTLLLIPAAYIAARSLADAQEMPQFLNIVGLIAGAISLLTIWQTRGIFAAIQAEKGGKTRYWLIIALIFMNVFFLGLALSDLSFDIPAATV
ncbi:MAG: AraC family transcriptional regulator, partial [Alphaproteobacteria bacterium]|nr:AraC family transcriptional regulator [Alphaproteobacteria bacterium]